VIAIRSKFDVEKQRSGTGNVIREAATYAYGEVEFRIVEGRRRNGHGRRVWRVHERLGRNSCRHVALEK
jgi:hypothetical protein